MSINISETENTIRILMNKIFSLQDLLEDLKKELLVWKSFSLQPYKENKETALCYNIENNLIYTVSKDLLSCDLDVLCLSEKTITSLETGVEYFHTVGKLCCTKEIDLIDMVEDLDNESLEEIKTSLRKINLCLGAEVYWLT